jgi:hypothetical protein
VLTLFPDGPSLALFSLGVFVDVQGFSDLSRWFFACVETVGGLMTEPPDGAVFVWLTDLRCKTCLISTTFSHGVKKHAATQHTEHRPTSIHHYFFTPCQEEQASLARRSYTIPPRNHVYT